VPTMMRQESQRLKFNGCEEDGNPPGLGPGQTRFDSEVPDHYPSAWVIIHCDTRQCKRTVWPVAVVYW
jgi:hypothetical protein